MKDFLNKLAGLTALTSGGYALYPLIIEAIQKGRLAYEQCLPPLSIFAFSVSAVAAALWQAKK